MSDAAPRKVMFVETRQIRRNHKTVQWVCGQTYDYDPEMEPMIKIGHARFVEEPKSGPAVEQPDHSKEASTVDETAAAEKGGSGTKPIARGKDAAK